MLRMYRFVEVLWLIVARQKILDVWTALLCHVAPTHRNLHIELRCYFLCFLLLFLGFFA
jgi:hypothetical protein